MPLYSRQDLADYCLRTLGAPVLNIEIADDQISDAIESSINFYNDYHPDGIDRDYVKHKITYTTLIMNDASLINVGDTISVGDTFSSVKSKNANTLVISKMKGVTLFAAGDILLYPAGTAVINDIIMGDVDNGWIPIDENIQGIIRILPWVPAFADGLFDITYQLRMNDLRNLSSGTMNYFTSTMEYLSMLDFILRKEKQFRFNRRMNRLYLDINWTSDVADNTYMIIECYRLIDADTYPELFNDPWLKKYAAANMKRYWGANLRKYSGVSLPGGVTMDGLQIYSEANQEITFLENDLIQNQAPLHFVMG